MGNSYFKFKQFIVHQQGAAMKVCTDSCVFGALLPAVGASNARVLDVGCGTGLLSMMYAQKCPFVQIDAIEIDHGAFLQTLDNLSDNLKDAPWLAGIKAYEADFKYFILKEVDFEGYDLIFSNPPFFMGDLTTGNDAKDKALHSSDLTFNDLVINAVRLLKENGIFCVLLPFARRVEMTAIAEQSGLYVFQEVLLRQTPSHEPFRVIQFYSRGQMEHLEEEIVIRLADQQYSLKFKELLEPYYLYL